MKVGDKNSQLVRQWSNESHAVYGAERLSDPSEGSLDHGTERAGDTVRLTSH